MKGSREENKEVESKESSSYNKEASVRPNSFLAI
jgi:hypothetical protein